MSSMELLYLAIFVFAMMLVGLGLTVMEFRNKFGADAAKSEVHRVDDAAEGSRKPQA